MATLPSGRLAQSPGILDPGPTVTSAEGLHCVSLQPPKPKVTDSNSAWVTTYPMVRASLVRSQRVSANSMNSSLNCAFPKSRTSPNKSSRPSHHSLTPGKSL